MSKILEVTYKEIENTTPDQLTELLRTLLYSEAKKYLIPSSGVHVPLKITVPDGGEDGRIEWSNGPEYTDFVPNRLTLFQCKAGTLSPTECRDELLLKDKSDLKPRVKEIFEHGGTYILFYNKNCNTDQAVPKVDDLRNALVTLNKPYASTAKIKIFDANIIAEWVNSELSAVVKVLSWAGKNPPHAMVTWNIWAGYRENQIPFINNNELEEKIAKLKNFFNEPKKVARLVGLSGLGKTRLVFETFRPPAIPEDDINQRCISEKVVYIDAGEFTPGAIIPINFQRKSGILVVDNCDLSFHDRLQREILHSDSQLSLLTIDFNPEEKYDGCTKFEIKPSTDKTVIAGIVSNAYPGLLSPIDIDKITEFAQGFPKVAVLLARARIDKDPNIGVLNDDLLVKKLIWGNHEENVDELSVLKSGAIFEYFGLFDEFVEQCEYITKIISGKDPDFFFKTIKKFIKRGIIQRRGRYVQIVPRPLAIRLASEWWYETRPEKIKRVICGDLPAGLIEPLCKQMQNLQFLIEARDIIRDLCGPQDPFGQAEILNTGKGSRIFRSMVEVNPQATVDALDHIFGEFSKDQLLEVGPGRRNLIWALEKLCFWRDTFPKAARLMMKFAVAENESWGNNATGQFNQLFHFRLSGTQASYEERLSVLDDTLESEDIYVQRVVINALGHALQTHLFSREVGVESQGSRAPQEEWKPTTWKEVFNYWDGSLNRLKKFALKDDEIGVLARSQIENSINGMIRYGRLNILEDVIFSICDVRGYFWPSVLYSLKRFMSHHSKDIPQEGRDRINSWIEKFGPKTIDDKTYITLIHPELFATLPGKNIIEESNKKVEEFVRELVSKPEDLDVVIGLLSKTHSTHGHLFGYILCNLIDDKEEATDKLIISLESVPKEQMDESVLGGFLFALRSKNSEFVSENLERIANNPRLYHLLLSLTSRSNPEKKDLDRLIVQIRNGLLNIEDFRILQHGSALSHLDAITVISFLNDLLAVSSKGCPVVFEIAYMYTFNDETKFTKCIPFFKKMLIGNKCFFNILKEATPNDHILHPISQMSISLIQQKDPDPLFATQLADEIIRLCSEPRITFDISDDIHGLISLILSQKYVEATWPIIGDAIVSGDDRVSICLKYLIGYEISYEKPKPCLLEKIPLSLLTKWCEENPKKAPHFLAEAIHPLIEINKKIVWSQIAEFLLNNYGDDETILDGLADKMYQFSWTGSMIPHYEMWFDGFTGLLNHINPKVKKWAEKNIQYAKKKIREIKTEEDEDELRFR